MSNPTRLLKIGLSGSVVAAVGCFTPLLVILVGLAGLSAFTGYLDYVVFPALAAFIALTLYALHKKHKAAARCTADAQTGEKR
jgi:mercuric ion transport protein